MPREEILKLRKEMMELERESRKELRFKKKTEMDKDEKLKLFKVAEEQLQTRVHNSKGNNIDIPSLITQTFDKLDIEALMPKYAKKKKKEAKEIIDLALSIDPLDKIKARELIKKDRELEYWTVGSDVGFKMELNKLCEEFTKNKMNMLGGI